MYKRSMAALDSCALVLIIPVVLVLVVFKFPSCYSSKLATPTPWVFI